MKMCLSKNGIKRYIDTPFAMAIGVGDLERLARHMMGHAAAMKAEGVSYTFVTIDPDGVETSDPNTPPLKWDDVGKG
jgi:hypothetical protein